MSRGLFSALSAVTIVTGMTLITQDLPSITSGKRIPRNKPILLIGWSSKRLSLPLGKEYTAP